MDCYYGDDFREILPLSSIDLTKLKYYSEGNVTEVASCYLSIHGRQAGQVEYRGRG